MVRVNPKRRFPLKPRIGQKQVTTGNDFHESSH